MTEVLTVLTERLQHINAKRTLFFAADQALSADDG